MLYNCGVLNDIFDVLAPFTTSTKSKQMHHIVLLKQCFRFIKAMTRDNALAQAYVFDKMHFLSSIKGSDAELGGVYIEVI